jgi:hypothetical protein
VKTTEPQVVWPADCERAEGRRRTRESRAMSGGVDDNILRRLAKTAGAEETTGKGEISRDWAAERRRAM